MVAVVTRLRGQRKTTPLGGESRIDRIHQTIAAENRIRHLISHTNDIELAETMVPKLLCSGIPFI